MLNGIFHKSKFRFLSFLFLLLFFYIALPVYYLKCLNYAVFVLRFLLLLDLINYIKKSTFMF